MIVFVRHGETPPNRDGLVLGRSDPELTEAGHQQAERLATALAGEDVAAILTSPLTRARQTAAVIASACGITPEVDERLVEVDWGTWEGRSVAKVSSAELERFRAEAGTAPAGESLRAVRDRVVGFCLEALERDGVVVAVTHVSPIKAAVTWVLDADDEAALRMFVALASITRIGRRSAGPVLLSFNETAHLR